MTREPHPSAGFERLRQAARKRRPLSFEALSASLDQAQAETGFVDTLGVEPPSLGLTMAASIAAHGVAPESLPAHSPAADDPLASRVAAMPAVPGPTNPTGPQPDAMVEGPLSGASMRRRGRVRAPFVQCNLKLGENLRDALHLQALRERRSVANLVTEVMTAYLTAKGTFERLR
jgi:hypothetical protein